MYIHKNPYGEPRDRQLVFKMLTDWVLLMTGLGLTTLHTSIVGLSGCSEPPIIINSKIKIRLRHNAKAFLSSPDFRECGTSAPGLLTAWLAVGLLVTF